MKKLLIIICIAMLLTSCYKEVSLDSLNFSDNELTYEIAVNGFMTNEHEQCKITLTKPVSVTGTIEKTPIVDAELMLIHNTDEFSFEYDTLGRYITTNSVAAKSGETWTLQIVYNGKIYTAQETMPDEPDDDFYIPFFYTPSYDDNEQPRPYDPSSVSLSVYTHNFGYNKTNIWAFEIARYYEDEILPHLSLYSYFANLTVYTHKGSLPQGIFPVTTGGTGIYGAASDTLEIVQAEISEEYSKYLTDRFNETHWQGGMFSTIPGNVSTNLSEGAIGYFYALNTKRKRFVIGDFDGHD